jgi:signal transduction histidine kinase
MAVASYEMLEEMRRYVGFDEGDARLLVEVGPLLEPDLDGVVDRFYGAIEGSPTARAVFEDEAQIAHQKVALRHWLIGVFRGVYDEAYYKRRERIGRAHVRMGLDQRYMFGAMNVVRTGLHESMAARLPRAGFDDVKRLAAMRAVDRILDIELAIMLETYAEGYARRIRSTERLATLGQVAASIGHELRNPLAVMETSLHLVRRNLRDEARVARHLERIGAQVAVCGEIISDLLDLARDRPAERQRVAPASLADEALALLPKFDLPIEIRAETDPLPDVRIDPGQVRQLLANLMSNALEATRGHGEKVRVDLAVLPGEVLRVRVDDEGPGISDEVRDRLFEPLFSTRTKGIGLGLALCQRIAEKHGGTIAAANRPEGGARFEVHLPSRTKRPR